MAKIIDLDIVLPVIVEPVQPNTVDVGTPEIISVGTSSIEVSQSFSSDVDYYGGIYVGETSSNNDDATLVKNPGYLNKTITGLSSGTTYYVNGVGIPVLGNITVGEQISVTTGATPIPDEYQLVEYLESTGTQYINTLLSDLTIGMYIEGRITNLSQNDKGFCGNVSPSNVIWWQGSQYVFMWRQVVYRTGISDYSINRKFELNYLQSGNAKIDDIVYATFDTTTTNSNAIFLFGANIGGNAYGISQAQIVNAKFSIANYKVMDMYPVYRKSDSKPGMYDIINNTFYTNAGTGEFIVGPDKDWEE